MASLAYLYIPSMRLPLASPLLILVGFALTVPLAPLAAQNTGTAPQVGGIRGTVVDAATARQLPGTQVTLLPRGGNGAFPDAARGAAFSNARTTTTDADGAYVFANLPPGSYSILVRRVGYDPATVDVQLAGVADARLSIGLVVHPVRLQPVNVAADALGQRRAESALDAESAARIAAARERQDRYLSTDVREVTTADVEEAVTLGSDDVLKALQRLPSVTPARIGGGLWVRSAPWHQTRVHFDGMPLLNPLGGLGSLTGMSAMSIGGAFLHPGARPVSLGGEGAARIDLQSPPGVPDGKVHGSGEVSSVGFAGFLAHRSARDRGGFHLAGRRSIGYLGLWDGSPFKPALLTPLAPIARFGDVTARADVMLGAARLEATGLLAYDRFLSAQERSGHAWQFPDSARSSTAGGRVSLVVPVGRLSTSYTASVTRSDEIAMRALIIKVNGSMFDTTDRRFSPVTWRVDHARFEARVASNDSAGRSGWSAGSEINRYDARFEGARQHLAWGELSTEMTGSRGDLAFVSLWGERRWVPTPRWDVQGGLRMDVGGSGLSTIRPAPSILGRYTLMPGTALSVSAARSHQYTQPASSFVAGGGPWLLAGATAPVLTVDQATAGVEHWRSRGDLLAAHLYARRSTGAAISEPLPGPVVDQPMFIEGTESAAGVELSARRLTGRVTGMLAYSYGLSRAHVADLTYVATSDRTHAFDATALVRLGRWRVGAGYTATSGSPYTRISPGTYRDGDPALGWATPPIAGTPGAAREPGMASLDLLLDWTWLIRRTKLTAFGRLGNALYQPRYGFVLSGTCPSEPGILCRNGDGFVESRRMSPSAGLRFSF